MMIYHYTPISSTQSILQQDRIHLWATNYQNLDDPLEFKWAKEFIFPKMKNIASELGCQFDEDFKAYPYTISFCTNPDDLTLWKLYTNWGKGIQLGFDYSELEKTGDKQKDYPDIIQSCLYANKENIEIQIKAAWKIYKERYSSINMPLNDLQEVCAFIKNEAYEVENEIRYCSFNYDKTEFSLQNTRGIDSENVEEVKFRTRGNELVSYKDMLFPKTMLKEIIIGYALDFDRTKENLSKLLNAHGYNIGEENIKQSTHQLLTKSIKY